jgi:WD40 repeat protein
MEKIAFENKSGIAKVEAQLEEAEAARDNTERLVASRAEAKEKLREDQAKVKVATALLKDAEVTDILQGVKANLAGEEVNLHKVKTKVGGTVTEIIARRGVAIEKLAPVVRIVNSKVVRVKGSIDLLNANRVQPGMFLEVYQDRPEGPEISLIGHTAPVTSVVFLPDGQRCVSASENGTIIEWDIASAVQRRMFNEHSVSVNGIAVHPLAPDRLVSGDEKGNLLVWDLAEGKVISRFATGNGIIALAMHPKEVDLCFTSHDDRVIRAWDLKTSTSKHQYVGHRSYVYSLALTPGGEALVSAGDDKTVQLWDLAKGTSARVDNGRSEEVRKIGLSSDGSMYLFNSFGNLEIRQTVDGRPTASFVNPKGTFAHVAMFVPGSNLVLAGTSQDELELWQMPEPHRRPRLVRRYQGHTEAVRAVDFSADGRQFVSGGDDRVVRIWPIPGQEQIAQEKLTGRVTSVSDVLETSQRSMFAEIDNRNKQLQAGGTATMVIYPDEPVQVAQDGRGSGSSEDDLPSPLPASSSR